MIAPRCRSLSSQLAPSEADDWRPQRSSWTCSLPCVVVCPPSSRAPGTRASNPTPIVRQHATLDISQPRHVHSVSSPCSCANADTLSDQLAIFARTLELQSAAAVPPRAAKHSRSSNVGSTHAYSPTPPCRRRTAPAIGVHRPLRGLLGTSWHIPYSNMRLSMWVGV